MKTKSKFFHGFLLIIWLFTGMVNPVEIKSQTTIPTPEKFFGFVPGSDNMLFNYEKLIDYLLVLDKASERLTMLETGISPMGKKMYLALVSSPENLKNLEELKTINKKLALDPTVPPAELEELIKKGKVFFLATLSEHSTEVAPSQSLPLIVYDYITTKDTQKLQWFENVVYMVVPCHNPDGMNMVVEHYNKYKGTKYDGCSMPGLYHKYVGHDNNRDFVTLTQSDTRAIADIYNLEWFPQVMMEKHQMGSVGPRYFVPPVHDPIAENVDAGIYNWSWIFGSNIVTDAVKEGLKGVSQHNIFDLYWPGSTKTAVWKGVVGMLSEGASVKYATPIFIEPSELRARGKGLADYKKSINMTLPWEGGWWRLGDLVKLEILSTNSIIKTCSMNREELLKFRNDVCKREVNRGLTEAPFYYILPANQHDRGELAELISLLQRHGVKVYQLTKDCFHESVSYYKGDIVIPLAQPFRGFIKEILEKQKYPERHFTPNGELIKPYDITSWSLSLHKGLTSHEIRTQSDQIRKNISGLEEGFSFYRGETPAEFGYIILSSRLNESYLFVFNALKNGVGVERTENSFLEGGKELPEGSFIIRNNNKLKPFFGLLKSEPIFAKEKPSVKTSQVKMPRIALVETWFHDMDAGWTRFLFDTYQIPFQVIRPGDFEKTSFSKNFDMVIFPNSNKDLLMAGKSKGEGGEYIVSSYPPDYVKGIGKKGMDSLMNFFNRGGIILAWGQSTRLFCEVQNISLPGGQNEEFRLPVNDMSDMLSKSGLECPGSFVKVKLRRDSPLTWGMPEETGVFYRGQPAFTTSLPVFDMDRRQIGNFPEDDILLSGYCNKPEVLANLSAMVWLKKNKGQLVLMAFNPQFRASTPASYKLIFNTILLKKPD